MGLFIGASLLTILEILDFLCEVGRGPGSGRGGIGPLGPGKVCPGHVPLLPVPRCSGTGC